MAMNLNERIYDGLEQYQYGRRTCLRFNGFHVAQQETAGDYGVKINSFLKEKMILKIKRMIEPITLETKLKKMVYSTRQALLNSGVFHHEQKII